MPEFQVEPAELVHHSHHVEAISAHVRSLFEVIAAERLPPEAYGKLAAPLSPMVNMVHDGGQAALLAASESAELLAKDIAEVAKEYTSTDEDNAGTVTGAGGGLGHGGDD